MEALAADKQVENRLAWVRPTLESWAPYALTAGLRRVVPELEPLSDEGAVRIVEIEAEIDGLIPIIDAEGTPHKERTDAEDTPELPQARRLPAHIVHALRHSSGRRIWRLMTINGLGGGRCSRVMWRA